MIQKNQLSSNLITAIDFGSNRCRTLIATLDEQSGSLRIIGVGNVPSRGIRRGTIVNLEEASQAVEDSVDMAEKVCGVNIASAYINVSGPHVRSLNSNAVVAVSAKSDKEINEIGEDDIDRVIEAARALALPADREVLNLTPRLYKVDSEEGIRDPLHMVGMRLETDIHLITASSSALLNLEKTLKDVGLDREDYVFSAYAASSVVLSEAEKDAGVICVDIGSDTTSYCVFLDGAITLSGVIPIGSRYITQDINAYTHVGLENAEKIKLALSTPSPDMEPQRPDEPREEFRRRQKKADLLNLGEVSPDLNQNISRSNLVRTVIYPRLKEICELLSSELKKNKITENLGAGIVFVGGGANTIGLLDVTRKVLNTQARVGVATGNRSVIQRLSDPSYITAIGLLDYGFRFQNPAVQNNNKKIHPDQATAGLFGKIGQTLKKFIP